MIIARYLLKEVLGTLLAVTFVLVLIFLCQQTVRYLNYIASGKIAANMLLQLIGFEIPYLLALLLPLGLYLGIILAYGRLYSTCELTVLHACGYEKQRLLRLTMLFAMGVALVVSVLTLWVNPWLAETREQAVRRNAARDSVLQTLMPGRFQATRDGKRVIYVEHFSRNHKNAENIFIAEEKIGTQAEGNPWVIVSARQGYQGEEHGNRYLFAREGYRYDGVPGQKNYRIIKFNKYAVRLPDDAMPSHQIDEQISSKKLWQTYSQPKSAAELQWRLSIPIAVLLLAWLAVPLSQTNPRQGRYIFVLAAILIYVVYVNLLFVARHWVEEAILPVSIGMWSVHLGFAALVFGIFMLTSGKNFYAYWRKQKA